jgi:protein involved in polysaccharide export with SLBB domain
MNPLRAANQFGRILLAVVWLAAGALFTGCGTTNTTPAFAPAANANAATPDQGGDTRLRRGDTVTVRLDTAGQEDKGPQSIDTEIDENGEISLPLIGRIKCEGLTVGELSERIQASYVPRFYIHCNVTILTTIRFFYVGGEVRAPGRYNWSDDVTLLKAINTAGGFSDYANRTKVELARGKDKRVYDCDQLRQHPEQDVPVQPGDSIYVARSIF